VGSTPSVHTQVAALLPHPPPWYKEDAGLAHFRRPQHPLAATRERERGRGRDGERPHPFFFWDVWRSTRSFIESESYYKVLSSFTTGTPRPHEVMSRARLGSVYDGFEEEAEETAGTEAAAPAPAFEFTDEMTYDNAEATPRSDDNPHPPPPPIVNVSDVTCRVDIRPFNNHLHSSLPRCIVPRSTPLGCERRFQLRES
jgi:hypothetical protein